MRTIRNKVTKMTGELNRRSKLGRAAERLSGLAGALCLVVAGAGTLLAPTTAHAENPALEGKPPVVNGVKLHDGRHALQPAFGMTLNDEYERNLLAGLSYRYYLGTWVGLGVDVFAGGALSTRLTDEINSELSRPDQPFALSTSSLQLLANAAVEIVPFAGKAMLFSDALVRFDVHINLGVGVALVSGSERIDDSVSIAPMFGVGARIFPEDWISIGFDIRDYLVSRALASRRDGSVPGASFGHNWMFGLSVGFFFPTTPETDRDESAD